MIAFSFHMCMRACSVMSESLQPTWVLCPWDFPGKNTGVGSHILLQGIFPTQRLDPQVSCISYIDKWIPLPLSHQGSPTVKQITLNYLDRLQVDLLGPHVKGRLLKKSLKNRIFILVSTVSSPHIIYI